MIKPSDLPNIGEWAACSNKGGPWMLLPFGEAAKAIWVHDDGDVVVRDEGIGRDTRFNVVPADLQGVISTLCEQLGGPLWAWVQTWDRDPTKFEDDRSISELSQ